MLTKYGKRDEQPIPEELFYLAGLQRIEQIFVFPEEQDLVIAGPAEGFIPERFKLEQIAASTDRVEGSTAFREKRPAKFKGL